MGLVEQLMIVVVGIPLVSGVASLLTSANLAERHHLHHDTYTVSTVVSRTLVYVMIFMGVLGIATGWLCHLGVYDTNPLVPLSFFVAFQLTMLIVFICMNSFQVMSYHDRMFVRPLLGWRQEVLYADIEHMRRTRSPFSPQFHDLWIRTKQGKSIYVVGLLDIEQILLRIDRFDVLVG